MDCTFSSHSPSCHDDGDDDDGDDDDDNDDNDDDDDDEHDDGDDWWSDDDDDDETITCWYRSDSICDGDDDDNDENNDDENGDWYDDELPARQLDVEVVVVNFVPFCCCQLHLKHQNDENGMKHGDDDAARFMWNIRIYDNNKNNNKNNNNSSILNIKIMKMVWKLRYWGFLMTQLN